MNIGFHPGYVGAFSTDQYPGAYPNGSRIVKAVSEEGDVTPTGTLGTVLGSVGHPEVGILYFVDWDDKPGVAIGTTAPKVLLASEETTAQ